MIIKTAVGRYVATAEDTVGKDNIVSIGNISGYFYSRSSDSND
jgi:hypothetical protein